MKVTIINCFETYDQRVDLVREYFESKNSTVSVITSDYNHFLKTYKTYNNKSNYRFVHALPYRRNLSYSRLKSHWRLAKDIFTNLDRDIEILWVMLPPNSFAKRASDYKKINNKVIIIFDIIDMWPETLPIGKIGGVLPLGCWKNLRNNNLSIADYIVTECDLYQKVLLKFVETNKLSTLYLAKKEYSKIEINKVNMDRKIRLCYLGSINNIIDIKKIKLILEHISKFKTIEFHIIGDGENKKELLHSLSNINMAIFDHGTIFDKEEKLSILMSCHYGLNVMKTNVFVGLTMKSIDYFEAGLPIINTIKGDTENFVNDYGIGINFDQTFFNRMEFDYDIETRYRVRKLFEDFFTEQAFNKNISEILFKVSLDERFKL